MCLRFQGSVYFVLHTHAICIPPKDTPQIEKKKIYLQHEIFAPATLG